MLKFEPGRRFGVKASAVFLILVSAAWIRFGVGSVYVSPDGTGCFAYFHSLLADGDLDFENEFGALRMPVPPSATPEGYLGNVWPIGAAWILYPAGLWALALHHFVLGIGQDALHWLLIFFNLASSLCGIASVWVLWLGLRDLGLSAVRSLGLSLLVFLGTPLFFYTFSAPSTPQDRKSTRLNSSH